MKTAIVAGFALATAAGATWAGSPESETQQIGPCSSREAITQSLAEEYHEAPVSLGVMANGNVLQVFASPDTGTWTIISIAPSGLSCVLAAGQSWEINLAALGPAA
jgi:hypothetical protein